MKRMQVNAFPGSSQEKSFAVLSENLATSVKNGGTSPEEDFFSLPDFTLEINAIRQRCAALVGETPEPAGSGRLLTATLEELAASLEALQFAAETMQAQNGVLARVRADLEAERRRYQSLFDSAPDACFVTDAQGCIREANRQAHALLQAGPRSLVGRPLTKFVPPSERKAVQALFRDTALGEQETDAETTCEMQLLSAKSSAAPIDIIATLSRLPALAGASGLRRWRVRPLPLQREIERHRALVAEVKDYAIILTDRQGQILDWNSGAEQIFGHPAGEVLGASLDLIFTPEDRTQGIPAGRRELAERDGRAQDSRWLVRKDGSRFWGGGSVTPLCGETQQEVRWFATVLQDRTAQKQVQEETSDQLRHASHIADTFQQALISESPMRSFPRLSVATRYEAASEEARVGGDFYDVFALSDGRVALAVGDVCGKGLGAAMRAGELKTAVRAVMREESRPDAALSRVNNFVCDLVRLDGAEDYLYTALALAVLDPETGALAVTLAGADPAVILRRDGSVETCGACGVLLGVEPEQAYQTEAAMLEPGARLLMVTDGLTEAHCSTFPASSTEEMFFGMAGVTRCATLLSKPLDSLCADVMQGAQDFAGGRLTDDACVLAAERL